MPLVDYREYQKVSRGKIIIKKKKTLGSWPSIENSGFNITADSLYHLFSLCSQGEARDMVAQAFNALYISVTIFLQHSALRGWIQIFHV